MRRSKHLAKLHKAARYRLDRLREVSSDTGTIPLPLANRLLAYATIECLNLWANFARSYFLSTILQPIRQSGIAITISNPHVNTANDAIGEAIKRCRPDHWKKVNKKKGMAGWSWYDEPSWIYPNNLIQSCDQLGCSNMADINAAFTFSTNVFEHLRHFRNFYAHRNEKTISSARAIAPHYSIPTDLHPTEILLRFAYGRPQMLILDWIDDVSIVISALCA